MTQPVKKFSVGGIQVSVWENDATGKDGEERSFNTVSFDRRYKDKEGEWKSTNSLKTADLPKAILALQKAYEFLALKQPEIASAVME